MINSLTMIELDLLAKEWIELRINPSLEKDLDRKLWLNEGVSAYAHQECLIGFKAWHKVKHRAWKLILQKEVTI